MSACAGSRSRTAPGPGRSSRRWRPRPAPAGSAPPAPRRRRSRPRPPRPASACTSPAGRTPSEPPRWLRCTPSRPSSFPVRSDPRPRPPAAAPVRGRPRSACRSSRRPPRPRAFRRWPCPRRRRPCRLPHPGRAAPARGSSPPICPPGRTCSGSAGSRRSWGRRRSGCPHPHSRAANSGVPRGVPAPTARCTRPRACRLRAGWSRSHRPEGLRRH